LTGWDIVIKHRLANEKTVLSSNNLTRSDWTAAIKPVSNTEYEFKILVPITAPIGQYEMKLKINNEFFSLNPELIVLFNPWHPSDSVFCEEEGNNPGFIDEYVLNPNGIIFYHPKGKCFRNIFSF